MPAAPRCLCSRSPIPLTETVPPVARTDSGWVAPGRSSARRSHADESSRLAAEWIKENAVATGVGAPEITEGSTFLQFSA